MTHELIKLGGAAVLGGALAYTAFGGRDTADVVPGKAAHEQSPAEEHESDVERRAHDALHERTAPDQKLVTVAGVLREALAAKAANGELHEPDAPPTAVEKALDILDTRMMSDASPTEKQRLESELRDVLDSMDLGTAKVDTVCGTDICRVILAADDPAEAASAATAFGEAVPKSFPSSSVYEKEGKRFVYLAKRATSLATSLPKLEDFADDAEAERDDG